MDKIQKIAIISALVLVISIVPAFALNDTNNTNGTGDQTQKQAQSGTCDEKNCNGQNNGASDGSQHKYMYGQENGKCNGNCDEGQHKNGQENCTTGNCGENCPKNK